MNRRKVYIIAFSFLLLSFVFCVLFSSHSYADEKCDNTAYDLIYKGRYLSEEQAKKLERKLSQNPDDLSQRTKLLGYYELKSFESDKAREKRQRHILWIIKNNPDDQIAGLPSCHLDPYIDGNVYNKARELWLQQIKIFKKNTSVLGNAANFFILHDKDLAELFLKKAQNIEPKNPEWSERLGHLYSLGIKSKDENLRKEASLKALGQFENAYNLTVSDPNRFYLLSDLAKQSFESGDLKKASKYANELIHKAAQYKKDWNYGNAIHTGYIILGRCALNSGQLEKAKEYLILSGKTPGSPQLNSFGPNMTLAFEILEQGDREVVIEYFKLCSVFWESGTSRLKNWTSTVRNGATPDFGANITY